MIVIYEQEKTYLKKSINDAKDTIIALYGEKLGKEAIYDLRHERIGASWRRNGGPLIRVVDKEKADWIREKETAIDMM